MVKKAMVMMVRNLGMTTSEKMWMRVRSWLCTEAVPNEILDPRFYGGSHSLFPRVRFAEILAAVEAENSSPDSPHRSDDREVVFPIQGIDFFPYGSGFPLSSSRSNSSIILFTLSQMSFLSFSQFFRVAQKPNAKTPARKRSVPTTTGTESVTPK